MRISIRQATSGDLDYLIEQLKAFSVFFGTKIPLFPGDDIARYGLRVMIEGHPFFIAENETGDRLGFIAGILSPHAFNPAIKVLAETFWWVPEEHRGTRAGITLLNHFIEFGKTNADWVTFALERFSPIKDETLIKRGFQVQERCFLMEVQ